MEPLVRPNLRTRQEWAGLPRCAELGGREPRQKPGPAGSCAARK